MRNAVVVVVAITVWARCGRAIAEALWYRSERRAPANLAVIDTGDQRRTVTGHGDPRDFNRRFLSRARKRVRLGREFALPLLIGAGCFEGGGGTFHSSQ